MRMKGDITDVNPTIDDSHLFMVNDLIFTSAGIMMWDPDVKVVEKSEKKVCENGCQCQDCDDEVGDNVEW